MVADFVPVGAGKLELTALDDFEKLGVVVVEKGRETAKPEQNSLIRQLNCKERECLNVDQTEFTISNIYSFQALAQSESDC